MTAPVIGAMPPRSTASKARREVGLMTGE